MSHNNREVDYRMAVMRDGGLSAMASWVMICIIYRCYESGELWGGQNEVAKWANIPNRKQAANALRELEEAGYLVAIWRERGKTTTYRLAIPDGRPLKKDREPINNFKNPDDKPAPSRLNRGASFRDKCRNKGITDEGMLVIADALEAEAGTSGRYNARSEHGIYERHILSRPDCLDMPSIDEFKRQAMPLGLITQEKEGGRVWAYLRG